MSALYPNPPGQQYMGHRWAWMTSLTHTSGHVLKTHCIALTLTHVHCNQYTQKCTCSDTLHRLQNKYYILHSQTKYFSNFVKSLFWHRCENINTYNVY